MYSTVPGSSFARPTRPASLSGATQMEGDRAAARLKVSLYCSRAYRLIRPPMLLPPMKVCSRSGRVRKLRSMKGLNRWMYQFMVACPLPSKWP